MLQKCSYQYKGSDYKKRLVDEVDKIAQLYPLYMAGIVNDSTDITGNALEILKLQADGMANDEIANTLFISKNTVKYSARNSFLGPEKLSMLPLCHTKAKFPEASGLADMSIPRLVTASFVLQTILQKQTLPQSSFYTIPSNMHQSRGN